MFVELLLVHMKVEQRISFLLLPSSIQPYISLICSILAFGWLENMKKINTRYFCRLMWADTKNHFVSLIFVILHVLWISDTVNCRNWGSFYPYLSFSSIAAPIEYTLQKSGSICWLNAKIVVFLFDLGYLSKCINLTTPDKHREQCYGTPCLENSIPFHSCYSKHIRMEGKLKEIWQASWMALWLWANVNIQGPF